MTALCPCDARWYAATGVDPSAAPRSVCAACQEEAGHPFIPPHGRPWSDYCEQHDHLPTISPGDARAKVLAYLVEYDGEALVGHAAVMSESTRLALLRQADVADGVRRSMNLLGLIASEPTDSLVYFIVRGDHVKIGRTRNLDQRLSALQQTRKDVLATIPGGQAVETEWHRRFAHLRDRSTYGGKEWFVATDELLSAIAQVA